MIVGDAGITVTGSGSGANPYVVSGGGGITVTDTTTVDLTLTGDGTVSTPYLLEADATIAVGDLTDMDDSAIAAGKVIAVNASATGYELITAPTATPGAISTTGGVDGDGSGGSPLTLLLDDTTTGDSGLIQSASGVRVKGAGTASSYTPIWTAATTNPTLGNGTLNGRYVEMFDLVWTNIELIVGSTTARGSGIWSFTLPIDSYADRYQELAASVRLSTGEVYAGVAVLEGGSTLSVYISTASRADGVSNSIPAALPLGSRVSVTGTYERGA